jgi:hypothetical protein
VPVPNHPGILQRNSRCGDAIPWNPQHVSDGFVREEQSLGLAVILRHEQASGQARQHGVKSMAQSRLRQLTDEGICIPKQCDLERRVVREFGPQDISRDAEGLASDLHNGMVGCDIDVQDDGKSDKAVVAGHGDFDGLPIRSGRQERH